MADLLIASSDVALRRRLARSLHREPGIRRIYQAKDRSAVERVLTKLSPPVLLLDLPMTGFDGLESLQTIRTLSPTTRAILLVRSPAEAEAVRALREGARGYCSRKIPAVLLPKAIRLVRQGDLWVGRKVIVQLLEELATLHEPGKAEERFRRLTRRERQIVRLIATGARNKEIAVRLSITERTVKAYLTHIFRKLDLASRLELAICALEVKLTD